MYLIKTQQKVVKKSVGRAKGSSKSRDGKIHITNKVICRAADTYPKCWTSLNALTCISVNIKISSKGDAPYFF